MTTFSSYKIHFDSVESVIRTGGVPSLIGFDSKFTTSAHPLTGNTIQGWIWDQRVWGTSLENNTESFAPTIFDPTEAGLTVSGFQSGIGDNFDCQLINISTIYPSGIIDWSPLVQHGYFYDHALENYLFSDWSVLQLVSAGVLVSGISYINMSFSPKPGIPIIGSKYEWDSVIAQYNYTNRFIKRMDFTGVLNTDGTRAQTLDQLGNIIVPNLNSLVDEMVLDYRFSPPRAYFNQNVVTEHGVDPSAGAQQMETLGISQGLDNEEYHTRFSPLLRSPFQIVTYATPTSLKSWVAVSGIHATGQVKVDYDMGVVTFGTGVGFRPTSGDTVAAHYKSTVALEYEPNETPDTITAIETNINPIEKSSSSGFVIIKRTSTEPFKLILSAETAIVTDNEYGPVFLGSSFIILDGLVLSAANDPVEGAIVTFNLLNGIGQLTGGSSSVQAPSDFQGIAKTTFTAPGDITKIGAITTVITPNVPSAGKTTVIVSGLNLTGDPSHWYIYSVFTDDPVLGTDSFNQYYTDYFTAEGITGPTQTDLNANGTGWENTHRLLTDLLTPNQYSQAFRNGKKQLVVTWDNLAYDPHTFAQGAWVPLRPESYTITSSGHVSAVYNTLLPLPSATPINNRLAGYFVAGPTIATLQANVYNQRTGTLINSNKIQLDIQIPPSMDGTVLIETLNSIEKAGIFGSFVPPASGVLPLGFRIRNSGVTLAGVLDGLTYLDVNRQSTVMAQSFTIVDSGVM